jgi:hypothetical protein
MPEAAQIIALCAALLLVASLFIWSNVLRGPLLQRLDGKRASNAGPAELASKVLVVAFGLSVLAAIVGLGGWIFS